MKTRPLGAWIVTGILACARASNDPSSTSATSTTTGGGPASARFFARNVIRDEAAASYPDVGRQTRVLASNIVYKNRTAAASDIESDNVEDALTETNVDVKHGLVGSWAVTNLGQASMGQPKTGQVTFRADGTYTLESGYCEACGSWYTPAVTSGRWFVAGNIIGFTYDGWTAPDLPVSRFAIVVHKRPNKIVYSIQGHTHGVETMERVK